MRVRSNQIEDQTASSTYIQPHMEIGEVHSLFITQEY